MECANVDKISLEAAPLLGGASLELSGNRIVERDDLAIVSIATPLGGEEALAEALRNGWSLDVPKPTRSSLSGKVRAVQTATDQMMLIFPHATPDAEAVVQERLGGTGYTTDQTDGWIVLEVAGPDTLSALERICPLDLPSFEIGGTGRTVMEHLGAMAVRTGDDAFLLMSASSSAASFLHAVETSYRYVT
jgi:sarcosine oxidase subunit gamma